MLYELIDRYGLWRENILVFGLLIFLANAGLPAPGGATLLLLAVAASQQWIPLWVVIAIALGATIAGDSINYWLGRRYGRGLLARHGSWLRITSQHYDRVQMIFYRHGPRILVLGSFVTLLRILAAFIAGVQRIPYRTFLRYRVPGDIAWVVLLSIIGYLLGSIFPLLTDWLQQIGGGVTSSTFLCLIGLVVLHSLINRKIAQSTNLQVTPLSKQVRIGLIVSALALLAFVQILDNVMRQTPLTHLDVMLTPYEPHNRSRLTIDLVESISALANQALLLVIPSVALFLWLQRRWVDLLFWLLAVLGGMSIIIYFKELVEQPRLASIDPLGLGALWEFPSGHAMMALITYIALAVLLQRSVSSRYRVMVTLLCGLLVLLVGFSRLYIGAHYFSDVLGGYTFGISWFALCLSVRSYLTIPFAIAPLASPTPLVAFNDKSMNSLE